MTRSLTIAMTDRGLVFDKEGRCRHFACTAQRGMVGMMNKTDSDPLFPAAGTTIPAMPGAATLHSEKYVGQQMAIAKQKVIAMLREHPSEYDYEGLKEMTITPVAVYPDRLNLALSFRSVNDITLGMLA